MSRPLPGLVETQQGFASAILEVHAPTGLQGPIGMSAGSRIEVYRSNAIDGLARMLADVFPATSRIVGEEFFHAMARAFAQAEPPRSPVLLDYGGGFANFVRGFPPAKSLIYLPDVAAIEWARHEAYHAADAAPIDAGELADVAPDHVHDLTLALHPALRVARSSYRAHTVWSMNLRPGRVAPIAIESRGEDTLVVRPFGTVEAHLLPRGGADCVEALSDGATLAVAAARAAERVRDFDLTDVMILLLEAGAVTAYALQPAQTDGEGAGS